MYCKKKDVDSKSEDMEFTKGELEFIAKFANETRVKDTSLSESESDYLSAHDQSDVSLLLDDLKISSNLGAKSNRFKDKPFDAPVISKLFCKIALFLCDERVKNAGEFKELSTEAIPSLVYYKLFLPEKFDFLKYLPILDEDALRPYFEFWNLINSQPSTTAEIADKEDALNYLELSQARLESKEPVIKSAILKMDAESLTQRITLEFDNCSENFVGHKIEKYLILKTLDGDKTLEGYRFAVLEKHDDFINVSAEKRNRKPLDNLECLKIFNNKKVTVYNELNEFTFKMKRDAIAMITENKFKQFTDPQPSLKPTIDEFTTSFNQILPELMEESGLNESQSQALFSICTKSHTDAPFILNGPPGTGKTKTIGQTVRYLLAMHSDHHILLVAPSNMAADMLALQIMELIDGQLLKMEDMLRLRSRFANIEKSDRRLDAISVFADEKIKCLNKKVVICTIGSSPNLRSMDLKVDYFSHIFIDEAGQATHSDFWVPIYNFATKDTSVILCGDPKQLGPVCTLGIKLTIESALLHYMSMEMYNDDDPRYQCFLNKSYRCHKSILTIASMLFYGNNLLSATKNREEPFQNWRGLPRKGFPILFVNVEGKEIGHGETGSTANVLEVEVIVEYAKFLFGDFNLNSDDVGIITPYSYQRDLMNNKLEQCEDEKVKNIVADSVERFQGSERKVILVTTTRTEEIGFLACDKRFNTALTRSINLIIFVGNKNLLKSRSFSWLEFINYCEENGSLIDWNGSVKTF